VETNFVQQRRQRPVTDGFFLAPRHKFRDVSTRSFRNIIIGIYVVFLATYLLDFKSVIIIGIYVFFRDTFPRFKKRRNLSSRYVIFFRDTSTRFKSVITYREGLSFFSRLNYSSSRYVAKKRNKFRSICRKMTEWISRGANIFYRSNHGFHHKKS
jgi:hypothetical protein